MIGLWIAVGVLALGVAFLGLVLAGAIRRLEELRREIQDLRADVSPPGIEHPSPGLPVGSAAPAFEGPREGGGRFPSRELDGATHLVVFAEPSCAACERLVPDLLRAAAAGEIPATVIVTTAGTAWPAGWSPAEGAGERAIVVHDEDGTISRSFESDFSPHVFVVDEGGSVSAQAPAGDLASVRGLLRDADGITIVRTDVRADG